jgi:hypothetical protein
LANLIAWAFSALVTVWPERSALMVALSEAANVGSAVMSEVSVRLQRFLSQY